MTPEDLNKAINEAVAKGLQEHLLVAVSTAVNASVNGKIDGLRKELQPITDAYKTWLSFRRMGIVTFGIFLAIGGVIQAAQAVWGIVQGHLVIKW
jgi:hypothetical protein